jgi:PAS domain S-box-containing protein
VYVPNGLPAIGSFGASVRTMPLESPAAGRTPADERYRQLFEENVAAQLVVDPVSGAIVDANRAAADFYGYSREALCARAVTDLAVLPDDDVLQTLEVAAELGAHAYAFPHRHASGAMRLVEIHAGPLTMRGRRLVHMIVHDVTERVRAEDAARDLHAERVAHQRTVELHAQLQRQETLSRIGALVAAVAHEVRNPLFAISSTLDAMRGRLGATTEVAPHFAVLGAQVDRLNLLMHELLDYGKPATLQLEAVEAGELVTTALDLTRALAEQGEVRLSLDVAAATPAVRADRRRLVQVLQNIVANAVQHSGRGDEVKVQVGALPGLPLHVEFLVLDRGRGFAAGDDVRIFEPFYSRRLGGTGMGLALAHRLVHDHGGEITAANRQGGGACLRVTIPAA